MTDTTDTAALREQAETAKACGGMFAISGEKALSLLEQPEAERQRADANEPVRCEGVPQHVHDMIDLQETIDELQAEVAELKGEQVPFMYAICHPDGSAWMDEGCVALNESHLGVVLADLRRDTGEDYRMVPVFTHSEPVKVVVLPGINELIDACGCTPAVRDINVWDLAISEVKRLNPSIFSDKSAAGGKVAE